MMSPSPTKTVARDLAASSTRAIVVHNARRGSPVLAALPGKLPVAIILFLLCVSASLRLEAAWISFSFTNYDGTPFSNAVVIIKPAGDPAVDAAGNVTAGNGFPTRIILSANGRATNWLQQQNYFVTNTFGGPNFLGKGYCFRAPLDSGPTVYPSLAPGLLITGPNYFVNLYFGTNFILTYNGITNSLGGSPFLNYVPTNGASMTIGNTIYFSTNYEAFGAVAIEHAAMLATNVQTLAAAANLALTRQAGSQMLTNLSATGAFTNGFSAGANITLTTNAGIVTITGVGSGSSTNVFVGAGPRVNVITNGSVFIVSADSQTNNFGNVVTHSASEFSGTNVNWTQVTNPPPIQPPTANLTNWSNIGTNKFALTNGSWWDINGAAFNATNGMQNGAFTDTNDLRATMINISQSISGTNNSIANNNFGRGTNTVFIGQIAITNITDNSGNPLFPGNSYIEVTKGSRGLVIGGGIYFGSVSLASADGTETFSNSNGTGQNGAIIASGGYNRIVGNSPYEDLILSSEGSSIGSRLDVNQHMDLIMAGAYSTNLANFNSVEIGALGTVSNNNVFLFSDGSSRFYDLTNKTFNVQAINGARFSTGGKGLTVDGFPVLTNGSVFTNNFTAIVYTNPSAVVYQSGSITSAVVQGTFASAGQLVFVVSTNLVNVTNPACLFFGQYQLNTGAPAWTNLNNSIQTLSQSGANFFFNTNGVPVFTATSLTGPWSAVGSASPVPLTVIGSYEYMTGPILGYFNSTNLTAQMLAIAKLSTNGFGNSVTHSTNEFDLAGIGAAFAQAATNNLGALAFQGNNTTVSNAQFSFTSTSASNALYIVSSNGIILFGYKPATGSVVIADTNNFVRVGINALYSILFAPDGLTQFQIKNDEFKFFDHSGFNQLDLTSSSANFPANLNVGGDATLTNNLFVKGIAYGNFFGATNLQSTNIVGTKFALSNDVVSLNTFTTNATTTISNNVAQKANTNSPTLFTPILVNSTGNFKGSVTNGSANATTQSNMTLFSSVFASANSLNTLFYTTISGTEVLGSSAPIYGTLAGGSGSGLAQMTNLFNSLITAQTLTPNNVNTNEFINGVSQELMDYNTITLLNSSNTVNLVYRILTGGIWTNVGSGYGINIVAGQYQNVDNAGNILFFRNGSPQGQWSVNYISTNAPTGDWGRVIDFSGALKATGIPSNSIVTVNAGQVVGTLPPADLNGIVFNGSGITNLGTSGIVTLTGGTNKVTANFQTNVLMTYLSVDGTASQIFLKPSEWSASNYFTIRSSNSSDTNQVYWWLKP